MFSIRTKLAYEDLDQDVLVRSRSSVNPAKFLLTVLIFVGLTLVPSLLIVKGFGGLHCRSCVEKLAATAPAAEGEAEGGGSDGNGEGAVAEAIVVSLADNQQLEGKRLKSRGGRDYLAFLGIPYAKPPLGKLRFQPPVEPESWNGTLDAREFRSWCIQKWSHNSNETTPTVGSENCLYLNIFTPKTLDELNGNNGRRFRRQTQLAVMVYVHGGGQTGNVNRYGADYLLDEDIVLVTFHYRLGVMGNLNTMDQFARGNQGLKDSIMALKWIQGHIASFGGDPSRVTLFGESSGAMSISAHLISPMSKGLFHRAILQSGTVLMSSVLQGNPLDNALALGSKLNCTESESSNSNSSAAAATEITDTSTEKLMNCLQSADAESVVLQSSEIKASVMGDVFTLSVEPTGIDDDVFLPDTPLKQLSNASNINSMPVMAGVTSAEYLAMSLIILTSPALVEQHNANWKSLLIQELQLSSAKDPEGLATAIHDFYIGPAEITNATERNLTYMFSDRSFVHPATVVATYQLRGNNLTAGGDGGRGGGRGRGRGRGGRRRRGQNANNVYLYQFNYPVDTSYVKIISDQFQTNYSLGVEHADDLQFLFPYGTFPYISLEHKDANFSKALVHLWVSFADTGVPDTGNNTAWAPVNQKPYGWYELDTDPRMIVDENGLVERMEFWDSLDLTDLYL